LSCVACAVADPFEAMFTEDLRAKRQDEKDKKPTACSEEDAEAQQRSADICKLCWTISRAQGLSRHCSHAFANNTHDHIAANCNGHGAPRLLT
jgi:Fe-S-cluster-containing hydrogenase component 2